MILCPLENTGYNIVGFWIQKRPRVTQLFGKNPQIYKQFGLKGHNGTDFGVSIGTPIYAPFDGECKTIDSGKNGYGKHVKIRNAFKQLEGVLGHFSSFFIKDGTKTHQGDLLGFSGNSGFSTGPHLHLGVRSLTLKSGNVWKATIKNYTNGFYGYWDIAPYMITYKGTILLNNLH